MDIAPIVIAEEFRASQRVVASMVEFDVEGKK